MTPDGTEIERNELVIGAAVFKQEGDKVKVDELVGKWDPFNVPIIAEEGGTIEFRDLIEGITLNREVKSSGIEEITVMEHREDLHPHIVIKNNAGDLADHHTLPSGAHLMVQGGGCRAGWHDAGEDAPTASPGTRTSRVVCLGSPSCSSLVVPRISREIARMSGRVEIGKIGRGRTQLIIRDPEHTDQFEEHSILASKHLTVRKGDVVKKGQKLTEGSIVPHDLLEICGPQELQEYLVNEGAAGLSLPRG